MRLRTLVTAMTACCLVSTVVRSAEPLKVGQPAPSFQTKDDSGKVWNSDDHYGKNIVVVYFYPAAMTGGCTKQACGFRDDFKSLTDKGVEVVGVSGDEVAGLALFKRAENLNFPLLSDTDGSVAKAFGVPTRAGGEISRVVDDESFVLKRGVTSARWTFVVDKNRKIAAAYQVKNAAGDSKEILKFVEQFEK